MAYLVDHLIDAYLEQLPRTSSTSPSQQQADEEHLDELTRQLRAFADFAREWLRSHPFHGYGYSAEGVVLKLGLRQLLLADRFGRTERGGEISSRPRSIEDHSAISVFHGGQSIETSVEDTSVKQVFGLAGEG